MTVTSRDLLQHELDKLLVEIEYYRVLVAAAQQIVDLFNEKRAEMKKFILDSGLNYKGSDEPTWNNVHAIYQKGLDGFTAQMDLLERRRDEVRNALNTPTEDPDA